MKKLIALVFLVLAFFLSWFYLRDTYPTTSPLKSSIYFLTHLIKPHAQMEKQTIGFLPYWRIDDSRYTRLDLITEVNYFGLFVNGDGEFVTVVNGETNPGWREWNNQVIKDLTAKTQIMGGDFTLTVICQNNDDIESILDDSGKQKKLIANILIEMKSRKLDGVNIDFEYLGDVDDEYQNKFTAFSKRLSSAVRKDFPQAKLSISIMPRAARSNDLFDFQKIVPFYDKFIGMSYDYYGVSSDIASATAPITGFKENKFFFDVTTTYEDYLKVIPKEKIIMGVPHYGWDWAVIDGKTIQSETVATDEPAVISYARALENKDLKKSQCKFDEYAKQPWCWYTDKESGADHQVWFEDTKSIGIKYDFANEHDFAGVAIWTLGYDKDYPDLWNLLKQKFSPQ